MLVKGASSEIKHSGLAELHDEFEKRGFFEKPFHYFRLKLLLIGTLFISTFILTYHKYYLLGAIFLGFLWRQSAFLTHFLEHGQLFEKRIDNQFWGAFFGTFLLGANSTWWRNEHNEHHLFTLTFVPGVGLSDPSFVDETWVLDDSVFEFHRKKAITKLSVPVQMFVYAIGCLVYGRFALMFASYESWRSWYKKDWAFLTLHYMYVYFLLQDMTLLQSIKFYMIASIIQGVLAYQLMMVTQFFFEHHELMHCKVFEK